MTRDRAHLPQHMGSNPSIDGNPANSSNKGGTYFLGRYRVVDEIGIGGMASVHLARMDGPGGFQKWVAIKRIHPHLVEDDTFVHMFLDEARVAARISHPNVATVFELGKHEDTYWIAMEYLHGEPLREVMRRTEELGQPMPPEIACRVIADAAEGLHAAHELLGKNGEKMGLVHRDVTPHNLFVTYDGCTKVVDFGIAKFSSRMASTRAGTLKGKLAYMSPEQVAGEQIDRRTDLFALGVVLWELTTGQRLFRMESDLDTLAKVQECNVPRPSGVVRGYPIDLEKIVMKALAKNKNERYKTAREFSRALQSLLMRRGLFIASDEVAGYTQSIFAERIQKREAHLRWAAEVTQTINFEGKLEHTEAPHVPPWTEPSVVSYNSEVHPSMGTMRAVPRPAAGAPATTPAVPGIPALTTSHPSAPTNPRPGASLDTARPPPRTQAPLAARSSHAPSQAGTSAQAPQARASRAPLRARAPDPREEQPDYEDPPTLARPATRAERHPAQDELPTMRANPVLRAEIASAVATERAARSSFVPPAPEAPPPEDFDDTDDTIVTSTRPEIADLRRRPAAPTPAAGAPPPSPLARPATQPPQAFSAPPRTVPPRAPAPVALPAVVVPQMSDLAEQDDLATSVDAPSLPAPIMQHSGSLSNEFPDPLATARSHAAAETHRLFAPPSRAEQRTVTAANFRRKIPLWAWIAAAAVLGVSLFVIVVVAAMRSADKPMTAGASTSASSPGPFTAARSAFSAAINAPPAPTTQAPTPGASSAAAPTPAPTSTDHATVTVASASSTPPDPVAKPVATVTPPVVPTATAKPTATPAATATATAATTFGSLTVICFPACDQVLDNGTPLGGSPFFGRKVPTGSRRLTLVWSNPPARKVVSAIVVADQETRIRINQ
jgi:serine/threonine protein kinase